MHYDINANGVLVETFSFNFVSGMFAGRGLTVRRSVGSTRRDQELGHHMFFAWPSILNVRAMLRWLERNPISARDILG